MQILILKMLVRNVLKNVGKSSNTNSKNVTNISNKNHTENIGKHATKTSNKNNSKNSSKNVTKISNKTNSKSIGKNVNKSSSKNDTKNISNASNKNNNKNLGKKNMLVKLVVRITVETVVKILEKCQ